MIKSLRSTARLLRLARAILSARVEGKALKTIPQKATWQQRQARRMLAALEVNVSVSGRLPTEGLIVCNHLSYLDILLIAAEGPVVFVAKSDVVKWPLVGGLLVCAGTILAERGRPLTAQRTGDEIRRVLDAGIPVVLFPEGTSSDGAEVLPFKPTLLQAALDAGAPITPAAVFYQAEGADPATDVCYWGDATFFPHLIRLARLRKIVGMLNFGQAAPLPGDRKEAARALQAEVTRLKNRLTGAPGLPG
jgi:lyso-ornithine lipid O-acyltransferase